MSDLINYGIDLGTTNSAISKFIKGEVHVFSNPTDYGRNTLPSVVGFKKDKILVGNQAKVYAEKDPKSVVSSFKRKMGTSETFKIKSLKESKNPIELSSLVLKELKTFLPPGELLDAAVITIPASFDTIQSNATKEAGYQAGFKQVILLQEPIAASLAYANIKKEKDIKDSQWLVYDLGGGTFDVALVRIQDGEMKVIDNEGNNFLGGADFDRDFLEKLIVPKIKAKYEIERLEDEMKSASGKLNAFYYKMLNRVEEAKILLTAKPSAEIVIDGIEDNYGEPIDEEITITRSEFTDILKKYIDETTELVKNILVRNSIHTSDVAFTLMVGGSTYIPYIRQRVEEVLQIPVNCEIDPTTAVAIGAAYYAATKAKKIPNSYKPLIESKITIKAAYQKASKEKEELFSAKIQGDISGLFYRIQRSDGGFDTGLKKLVERINEDLPLVDGAFNYFELKVYDKENNLIQIDFEPITINSGYSPSGQPLPEDICIEIDSDDRTRLEKIFDKNQILPLKRTITKSLNRTLLKGDSKENIKINVLEGPHYALPEANKCIGSIIISGHQVSRDIAKGSDIELTIEISESRDLTVSAYLNMADQEFKEVFSPNIRHTTKEILEADSKNLDTKIKNEMAEAIAREDFEVAEALKRLEADVHVLCIESSNLQFDDVTDLKYQLENKKRKIAQEVDSVTRNKQLSLVKTEYYESKEKCLEVVFINGTDYERKYFTDIVAQEAVFLSSSSTIRIKEMAEAVNNITWQILFRIPAFLKEIFNDLCFKTDRMNDHVQAKSFVDAGRIAIENQNWERLKEINIALINLLPSASQEEMKTKIGFN